jgi:hypothetical protein
MRPKDDHGWESQLFAGVGTVTLATRTVQFDARIIMRVIFLLKSYSTAGQLNRFPRVQTFSHCGVETEMLI